MAAELSVLLERTKCLNWTPFEVIQTVSAFIKVSFLQAPCIHMCSTNFLMASYYWAGPSPRKYTPCEVAHPKLLQPIKTVFKMNCLLAEHISVKLYFVLLIDWHSLLHHRGISPKLLEGNHHLSLLWWKSPEVSAADCAASQLEDEDSGRQDLRPK